MSSGFTGIIVYNVWLVLRLETWMVLYVILDYYTTVRYLVGGFINPMYNYLYPFPTTV